MKLSANKIYTLNDWTFTKNIPDEERILRVKIYLKSPDQNSYIHLEIPERKKFSNNHFKARFNKLINNSIISDYEIIGNKVKPRGIITKIKLSELSLIAKLQFVDYIFIDKMNGAKKKKDKKELEFFCVRMTVLIQVEGVFSGMQTYEDRFVLIKAKDFEDAYRKLEKQEKVYVKPYLNTDMRLVRWKIISYDDCYSTGIKNLEEFNNKEGVEVFSKLGRRKVDGKNTWDGQ
jgi:hypothetical protein